MWQVGIDTGGTFTDLFARSSAGEYRFLKVPSTPPRFEDGIVSALERLDVPLGEVDFLGHGTTVGTNALISTSGPATALLTTEGFRDVLELRRHNREELYDIFYDPPPPLIVRHNRFDVPERMNYAGMPVKPLDTAALEQIAETLLARGVAAVAIVFLHSYVNPEHERRARETIQQLLPDAYVTISSDLIRETHEFERTSTTAVNAYLGPVMSGYIRRLQEAVGSRGLACQIMISHSGGGLQPAGSIVNVPARTVNSGPAAGALGAAAIARLAGRNHVLSVDMGGTSTDIAVVVDGVVGTVAEYSPRFGMPIRFPSVDLTALGAGGGSIAWVDPAGSPKVGPDSAGANPGPACYGKGGTAATITDANLVLGRLSSPTKLAGTINLDLSLAQRAIHNFAARLGIDDLEAADGIIRIAIESMNQGIRLMTVRRGLDPREFMLLAFGGAGPMHAVQLARAASIPEVLVPWSPGVLSAIGLLYSDIVHDLVQTLITPLTDPDFPSMDAHFVRMEEDVVARLEEDGVAFEQRLVQRVIDIRYTGQVKALSIPLPPTQFSEPLLGDAAERFYTEYERRFRFSPRDIPLEIAAVRVQGRGVQLGDAAAMHPLLAENGSSRQLDERPVYFDGQLLPTPVFSRTTLSRTGYIKGPAIVEQIDTTIVIPPGADAQVDDHGNIVIRAFAGATQ